MQIFLHFADCRSFGGERCGVGDGIGLYDGGNSTFPAIPDPVKTGGENPLIEPVYRDRFCGNLDYWL